MNCVICKAELEREERWDGSYSFSCPICKKQRGSSTKAPKEISLVGGKGADGPMVFRGLCTVDWNKLGEDD